VPGPRREGLGQQRPSGEAWTGPVWPEAKVRPLVAGLNLAVSAFVLFTSQVFLHLNSKVPTQFEMEAAAMELAMGAGMPDLKFLFDREGVAADLQAKFFEAGIVSMRQFAAFAADGEELRKSLKEDFALDPASGLQTKITISKVVVAWESAKVRSQKMAEAEAEAEIRQEAKPVRGTDFKIMREAYEAKWWKLEKEQVPARVYIEKISEGIERAEPRAEALSEVVNCLEGEIDILKAVWDVSGSLKAIKTSPSVALPRDPEELRQRLALLGRAWAFVALGQPNCKYLQGGTPQMWTEYLDYLLGPYVHKLYARDAYGSISSEPPWNLLLSYELEIRRKMVDLMAKGTAINAALPTAYKDSLIKERYFTTPLAIGSSLKRPLPPPADPNNLTKKQRLAIEKGKGKGKGRKGKQGRGGKGTRQDRCAAQTPDGKRICYGFNDKSTPCAKPACTFLHVCGRCFKDHPMWQCPN